MRSLFFGAALLLALAPAAQAQVSQGLQEINVSGSATFYDDFSNIFVSGSYGYFVTPVIEVGPTLTLSRFSFDGVLGGQSSTAGLIGAFTHIHLAPTGATTVPFFGGELGIGVGASDGVEFGVLGGAKFFLTPGGAITPAAFLRFNDDGDSVFGIQLGISLFF